VHVHFIRVVGIELCDEMLGTYSNQMMRRLLTSNHSVVTLVRLEGDLFNRLELVFS
jgi:hypothetical protein